MVCFSQNGYSDSYFYSLGIDMNFNFIGWNGNSTLDVETIIESIITLKKDIIFPEVTIKLRNHKEILYRNAEIEHVFIWSLGRCLQVVYPEESKNAILSGLQLTINKSDVYIRKNFVVHFMDRNSGTKLSNKIGSYYLLFL